MLRAGGLRCGVVRMCVPETVTWCSSAAALRLRDALQRPTSAFSNPEMAAEIQRLEWRAARRACGPRSAPAAGRTQPGPAGLQHTSAALVAQPLSPRSARISSSEGLTAVTSCASAPVSASRARDHGGKARPHSSPLLTQRFAGSAVERAGAHAGRASERGAPMATRTTRNDCKGVTMAKSTRQQSLRCVGPLTWQPTYPITHDSLCRHTRLGPSLHSTFTPGHLHVNDTCVASVAEAEVRFTIFWETVRPGRRPSPAHLQHSPWQML